uniref:PH domain-containing protein n=1 Tax=Trichobilharzia regenti TaxID=157069 RepID=A0AA85JCT6_TRIRE|nr:unnamed protein product [Trichobilharzia regenti]
MNPPKCTCRCTCKSAQHSNMGNVKRNSSCSLQTPGKRKSDQLQSSNPNELHFTAEQQNMILKIEACNREILQEIYRLQSESVKTNDAISLLKEHANVIQTSCLSPRLPQREFPTYPSVVCNKKSSISGSSTSSSGIRDNSSTCVNDDSRVINFTQQTVKRNEDQITRQLELLRDRQCQLMLKIESLKKNCLNEVSEADDNHLSQTLFDQLTEIMDRFDLSSPPPPAPNSSLYGFTDINPCSNYADVRYKQNSNLQLKNTSSEEEFDFSLEPDYFQIGQDKSKLPQRISLEHYDAESKRDDEPKPSLNSSDMIRNTGLNVSREKFSDRLLRARQAIDLWECQINRNSYEKGSHVPFPDVGQNQQLKLNSDTKAATLPQVSSSLNANFPTRCNSLTNKSQINERIAPFQGFTSLDTHSKAKTSYQKDNLSTLHPSSSKAMPVQIVKPAVRNQNINNPYKDNDVKQSTKNFENQITNHQTQPLESHQQQTQNNKPNTYVDKTSNNDRRQIKGVLVSENSKGERTSRTSRNPRYVVAFQKKVL